MLFRLTPAAFDNDRAWWGQSLATAYWERGNAAMARVYADSALPTSKSQLDVAPDGGMAFDPAFFVPLEEGMRAHQVKLQGGDASSDSFCFAG